METLWLLVSGRVWGRVWAPFGRDGGGELKRRRAALLVPFALESLKIRGAMGNLVSVN